MAKYYYLLIFIFLVVATPCYGALNVAFIVADAGSLNADTDTPIKDWMEGNGHTVTLKSDEDEAYDPTTFDCVVISESIVSGNVAWLKSEVVGLMTFEASNYDEFELATSGDSNDTTDDDWKIVDNTHYITNVFTLNQVVDAKSSTANAGWMKGEAGDVAELAQANDDATQSQLYAVDKGGTLQGGVNTAADRRVYFAAQYFALVQNDGITLAERALDWIAYNTGAVTRRTWMIN